MWRPLINIINNKYLDTPECSQPWGTRRHKNIFATRRQLRRWRRLPLCRVPTRLDQTRPGLGKIERETERAIDSTLRRCRGDNIGKTHTHTYHGIPCSPALLGLGSFPLCVPPFPSPVPDFIAAVSFRFLSNVWLNDGIDGWITRKR